jgi:hypothetical protein
VKLLCAAGAIAAVLTGAGVARADDCAEGRAALESAPARAWLQLTLCGRAGTDVRTELARLEKTLQAGSFTPVEITVAPAGAEASVDTLGAVRFPTPLRIWLAFGVHEVTAVAPDHYGAMRRISIDANRRFELSFRLDPLSGARGDEVEVDFSEEGAVGELTTADTLPSVEHETLLPKRFRGGVERTDEEQHGSRVAYGLAAALSRSSLPGRSGSARLGAGAVALLSYRIRRGVTLQPELSFAMRGEEGAGLDYVGLAILGGYRHRVGGLWLHVGVGPAVNVALATSLNGEDVNPLDVGLASAVGVLAPIGPGLALLDLRADLGLTTVVDQPQMPRRSRAVALRLGYLF